MLLESQNDLELDKHLYLKEIYNHAIKSGSKKWLASYYANYGVLFFKKKSPSPIKYHADSAKYYYLKSMSIAKEIDSLPMLANLSINMGSLHSQRYMNIDSTVYYYDKALELYNSGISKYKDLNVEFNIYNNFGNAYKRERKYSKALKYYNKAEDIQLPKLDRKSKKILFSNMESTYYYLEDWYNAYDYLYKLDSIKKIINLKEQNTLIAGIEEKYNNEKLRADKLVIEAEKKESELRRKKANNFLIASLVLLLFSGIIFFLIQKNTKRKQKLAEQSKKLETQKLATALKEQELITINAMIEEQEKERQRIANDLHDDLGGLMSIVKWNFDALKEKNTKELFEKTDTLLDEAYQKIRSIAHSKNSGVIAKQGLLKAVQNMAIKISASNKIQIDVVAHGLEYRLENSLELTIFRIIQELITNIIKHADATETTIHLTNHNDILNIMVEDNGKGFDSKQITKVKKGMGISSIDKRVEHLNGKLTIESEINKGTTIIIDLPI